MSAYQERRELWTRLNVEYARAVREFELTGADYWRGLRDGLSIAIDLAMPDPSEVMA